MNYAAMSDKEINQAVTASIYGCGEWGLSDSGDCFFHCGIDGAGYFLESVRDYCNNPSDAWPVIMDNHIMVGNDNGEMGFAYVLTGWCAPNFADVNEESFCYRFKCDDKNPLRAAMIVYLMMQEDKAA